MIALLRGRIVAVDDGSTASTATVDVGGVGYEVHCHGRALAALRASRGDEVVLHVHTAVSEDSIRLFGFLGLEELRLFRLLIAVDRVGPKVALGILGHADPPALIRAIRGRDAKLLSTAPGIGPKTAAKIVVDLVDRVGGFALAGEAAPPGVLTPGGDGAVVILVGMGYREAEAAGAVTAALAGLDDETPLDVVLREALRRLDTAPG